MISVIVPAYNAEKTIKGCLDALLNQDYNGNYEVIIVDDGSTDSTAEIISGYPSIRLIRQQNAGPAIARNRGAFEAKGDIIFFTDSDCVPEKDWLRMMSEPFGQDKLVVGVKGIYKTGQREIAARFVQLEYEDKYDRMKKGKTIDFIDTYSAAFKREVFTEMNGYDTSFPVACAEDIELSYRISSKGYKMVFNPNAIVYHIHPNSLIAYLKKKYKFAFWRVLAVKKNPQKIVSDSHTPQSTKIELILIPLIYISAITAIFYNGNLMAIVSAVYILIILFSVFKMLKKDIKIGILSPILIFLRDNVQFAGLLGGVIKAAKDKLALRGHYAEKA